MGVWSLPPVFLMSSHAAELNAKDLGSGLKANRLRSTSVGFVLCKPTVLVPLSPTSPVNNVQILVFVNFQ